VRKRGNRQEEEIYEDVCKARRGEVASRQVGRWERKSKYKQSNPTPLYPSTPVADSRLIPMQIQPLCRSQGAISQASHPSCNQQPYTDGLVANREGQGKHLPAVLDGHVAVLQNEQVVGNVTTVPNPSPLCHICPSISICLSIPDTSSSGGVLLLSCVQLSKSPLPPCTQPLIHPCHHQAKKGVLESEFEVRTRP
jgi:hypothetical protein